MFMEKRLKEESGAALVWAICAATIVLILVGASMTLATAYHERTLNETATKQSYFSALSASELIAGEIVSGDTFNTIDELMGASTLIPEPGTTRDEAQAMNVIFSDSNEINMGTCNSLIYWKDDKTLVVESKADYKETSDTVKIEIKYSSSDAASGGGESPVRNIFGIRNGLDARSNVSFKNTDIYLLGIDHNYRMDWLLNEGNELFATKSLRQSFFEWLSDLFFGNGWFERIFGSITMDDFTIITENYYDNVVNTTVKEPPSGAGVVVYESGIATEIERYLENLEVGKTYVINFTGRNNNLNLDIGFSGEEAGTAEVYFVRDEDSRGKIAIETIEEGIDFYYYSIGTEAGINNHHHGHGNDGNLILGKNNSTLNMFGGIYTDEDIKFMGDINYNGYLLLESNSPRLNFTGNTIFNMGYAQTSTVTYSWEINKYTD